MQKITTLTEQKKQKLLDLKIKDSRIKKMLDKAIENWSKPGVKIANRRYGVSFRVCNEGYEIVYRQSSFKELEYGLDPPSSVEGSCLISSSMIGRKESGSFEGVISIFSVLENEYNFSEDEFDHIVDIFDYNVEPYTDFDNEIKIIRDVVFEDID